MRSKAQRFAVLAVCWTAIVAAAPSSGTAQPAPLDPYLIYTRCVSAMGESATPPYMTYLLNISANHISISRKYASDNTPVTILHFRISHHDGQYRVWYRGRDQRSLMQDLGSSEMAVAPPIPWALDFHARTAGPTSALETASSGAITTNQEGALLQELSTDESQYYQISFAGVENIDNHLVYHLRLQPKSGDPNEHALRDLAVDPLTFRARQVVMEIGQHTMLYGGRLVLTANFEPMGPYWLNTSGRIDGRGYYAFFFLNGSYTYSASQIAFPNRLPDTYFDNSPNSITGLPRPGSASSSALDFNN